jgi:hypothetical protein
MYGDCYGLNMKCPPEAHMLKLRSPIGWEGLEILGGWTKLEEVGHGGFLCSLSPSVSVSSCYLLGSEQLSSITYSAIMKFCPRLWGQMTMK